MIFNYDNCRILVNVPQKSGITSVLNIMAYPFIGKQLTKNRTRSILSEDVFPCWHNLTDGLLFDSCNIKIAVIRDPIDRIVSVYNDRVRKKNKDNTKDYILDFDYFVENFNEIRKNSKDIRTHSRPQYEYLGHNVKIYDHIFLTKQINFEFKTLIEQNSNCVINTAHSNRSQQNYFELLPHQIDFFKNFYKQDYEIYGEYL